MLKSQPSWLGPGFELGTYQFETSVLPLLQLTRWRRLKILQSTPVVKGLSYSPLDPRFAGSIPAGIDEFFFRA